MSQALKALVVAHVRIKSSGKITWVLGTTAGTCDFQTTLECGVN